jgi:hypothetical protein
VNPGIFRRLREGFLTDAAPVAAITTLAYKWRGPPLKRNTFDTT